ncbi:MAG: HAMP domain-containing histidine kinase [Gammaproteobacteria bacterium]|nr:HAMP domain-containing histidine kinase [Gammaproteobacteria bacterium]
MSILREEVVSNSVWAKLTRSLSFRLVILFTLFTITILVTLKLAVGFALDSQFKENIRPHVAQYLGYIRKEIGNPPSVEKAQQLTDNLPIDIAIVGKNDRWTSLEKSIDFKSLNFHTHKRHGGKAVEVTRFKNRFILKTTSQNHQLFLLMPERPKFVESITAVLITAGLVILLIYLCYRIIRWLFNPVSDIQIGVANYSEGNFDHHIPVRRNDDLGMLVERINTMASDIKNMLDAKRQLMLGVSHELRSPITRAKVNVALLDDSPYKEALDSDLTEMEAMISELLESERLNTSHRSLDLAICDLSMLVEEVLVESFAGENILFDNKLNSVKLNLDAKRIKLLLRNLISNALRYTSDDGAPPEIQISRLDKKITLSVRDHGMGISPEHIDKLTEPFYRVDSARARQTGGYGLGLYLCRLIVEAHGGELSINSKHGIGTTVNFTLEA